MKKTPSGVQFSHAERKSFVLFISAIEMLKAPPGGALAELLVHEPVRSVQSVLMKSLSTLAQCC